MNSQRSNLIWIAALAAALVGLFAFTGSAAAAPAAPGDFPYTQPDGTVVTVRQWGDEWQNGFETPEGYTVLLDENSGFLVYAETQPDGSLAPAQVNGQLLIAGAADPSPLPQGARPSPIEAPFRAPELEEPGIAKSSFRGKMDVVVILVYFSNIKNQYSAGEFKNMMFGTTKSVRDFYLKGSFKKLNLAPAAETYSTGSDGVIGWLKLPMNHPNPSSLTIDASWSVARAALNAANPYINFASFDDDKDGYVTGKELQVVIVAAGYERSYNYSSPGIWAHQYSLDASPLTLDGKRVAQNGKDGDYGGYVIVGERHGSHRAQFGTTAHEFGHLLSLPDLYDTSQTSEGVGEWSIMGSGSWNGSAYPGDTPALPDAWSKWYQGWISPWHAVDNRTYSLRKGNLYPEALKLGFNENGVDWDFYRKSGIGEYWLVENRQLSGYDAQLPGCGLLIWHINERVTSGNSANTWSYGPLVALEQADGYNNLHSTGNRGDGGDPYPGWYAKLSFNGASIPNSRFYNGAYSTISVQVIDPGASHCADTMRLRFTTDEEFEETYIPFMQK